MGERSWLGVDGVRVSTSIVVSIAVLGTAFLMATQASAIPAFARKEGQDCGFCHTAYPKLNEAGRGYKQNGLNRPRIPGHGLTLRHLA